LLREKMDGSACKGCPYFALEPSEYRLFKRTWSWTGKWSEWSAL